MKKFLLISVFLLVILYSCSPEEETKAPTNTVQSTTPEPEPETPAPVVVQYTLTVTAGEGGSVTNGGTFDEGTSVSVTATPNEGYEFVGWEGIANQNNISLNISLNSNLSLNAIFSVKYSISEIEINHPQEEEIWTGSGLAVNSSLLFYKNNKKHLIFTPAIGRGEREYFLPIIHAVKADEIWDIKSYYEDIQMSFGGRDVDFFDNNNIFYADHGSEHHVMVGGDPSYNHVWYASNINDETIDWTRVSEKKAYYHNVSSGDLNNDGLIDAVAVHLGGREDDNFYRAVAFIQKNDRSFEHKNIFEMPLRGPEIYNCFNYARDNGLDKNNCPSEQKGSVLIKDIDGDNLPEIIVSAYNTYQYPDHYSDTGFDIWSDKNQDGIYNKLFFFDNTGWYNKEGLGTSQVKSTDIDNDGDDDLLIMFEGNYVGPYSGTADFNGITTFINNGEGTFTLGQEIPFFDIRTAEFELIDFDNDGDEDIIFNVDINCDLKGCALSSNWYNGDSNLIYDVSQIGETFAATIDFDYLIWENDGAKFVNIDNGFEIELDKLSSLNGQGLRFIKGTKINNEFIFFGIYQDYDSEGQKKFNVFEYIPNIQ